MSFSDFYTQYLQNITLVSITLRLTLAVIFGGIIGLERGSNKHPAGFRTHILVCVGSTLAMLTNQYIYEFISFTADPARLGAQVISGIGFLGVGTILVTGGQKIRGLTTAAGLWASACTGLALGIGFYSGAIVTGLLVFIVLAVLPNIENYFYHRSRIMNLYVEVCEMRRINDVMQFIRDRNIYVIETHVSRTQPLLDNSIGINLSVKIPKHIEHMDLIKDLALTKGIQFIEEL